MTVFLANVVLKTVLFEFAPLLKGSFKTSAPFFKSSYNFQSKYFKVPQ